MNDQNAIFGANSDGNLILVVDDEFDVLSTFKLLLEYNGFRVLTAGNGRDALTLAMHERPDLVVSDFMMPVMDGGELCREWRVIPELRNIPFILSSAGILRNDVEIPYDSFFKKPIRMEQMIKEIKRLIALREAP